ncbi:MAG: AAA family ATPase [Dysgonamonadaceae bacterium]|jgi:predicted ATPase|nr:AAA family ATPase [Dysgonamonadaceae bacterium]
MTTLLKKIGISGYKSISSKHPVEIELGNINILLGANGSGKSNIISFFKMLNFMMSGSFQLFVEKAGTSQVFLHYGAKHTNKIQGELLFENQSEHNLYSFTLTHAALDRLIITSEEIGWFSNNKAVLYDICENSNFKESALIKYQDKDKKDVLLSETSRIIHRLLSNCKVYQFHDSSPESPIRQSSPVDISTYLQAEGNNLASFLYYLKNTYPSYYKRIASYTNQIMPQFKDFYLEPNGNGYVSLKWTDIYPNDYVFLPEQFSDGTIRFIALATLLLQPEKTMPNVIIVDEPELGLHPSAIGQLAAMLKEAAMHTQIIVATQSTGLIDEFEAKDITVIESDKDKGFSTARKLNEEELTDWLENYSLSELWNKNVIGGRP